MSDVYRLSDAYLGDPMETDESAATPDRSLDECFRLMKQHGIYHLLVVDADASNGGDGAYRGMLSVTDLLTVIASDEKARADMLEAFVFERTPSS